MRKFGVVIAALAATLALSACSGEEAVPAPSAATETARPALSTERFSDLQSEIFESVSSADSELDKDALSKRAMGPFLKQRTAEYKLKSILADSYGMDNLSTSASQTAISTSSVFPRIAVSIMDAPQGSNLQTIDVFAQSTARNNWGLWGVMSILPGATVPGLAVGNAGAATVAADDSDSLVASPGDVLAAYVALNQTRSDSKGLTFADDSLRQTLADGQDANAKAVEGAADVTMQFAAGSDGPLSVVTEDGGALVMAQMNFVTTIKVTEDGATVKLQSTIGALGTGKADGEIEVSGTMAASYTVLVAFHVPAADADDSTISVVGASDPVLLSVKNG